MKEKQNMTAESLSFEPEDRPSSQNLLLRPRFGWLSCRQYPFVQITPRQLCVSLDFLVKAYTGKRCPGLVHWLLDFTDSQRLELVLSSLNKQEMYKYKGIGKRTSDCINALIKRDIFHFPQSAPILLAPLDRMVTTGEELTRRCQSDSNYISNWLIAVDTKTREGVVLISELFQYQELTYNHRLHLEQNSERMKIRFMVDDIANNCFLGGR